MAIFGLTVSGDLASYLSENARREVFYRYPSGKFPLTGILSMMDDEETDKQVFGWWEERDTAIKTATAASGLGGGGGGPFGNAAFGAALADGANLVANTEYTVKVVDASQFRVHDLVWIRNAPNQAASTLFQIKGVVTAVSTASNYLKFRPVEAHTAISNDTDANGLGVFFYGSAAPEATKSRNGSYSFPIEISNNTQIHKHGMTISRSALKAGVRYDQKGIWQDKAKKLQLRHMKGMELTNLHGVKSYVATTNEDGDTVGEYKTGGIEWFLKQWEKGNTGNGGAFDYRPGGSDISASAWNADDDKRILDINGSVTVEEFESIIERAFRYTDDATFEKLCLCGVGFLTAFNRYCELKSYKTTTLNSKEETFGMQMTRLETLYGNLVFKTHPLMNESAEFRYDAYILDVGNLKYRPLSDSDTEFLEGRQDNDFDGRKDSWLTEAGIEVRMPETHMHIKGLQNIVV